MSNVIIDAKNVHPTAAPLGSLVVVVTFAIVELLRVL
jgi:hypothetical protein